MEQIRSYLITISATAIICSVVLLLTDKKSVHSAIVRILCGIFLCITVLSPIIDIQLDAVNWTTVEYIEEGKQIAANAQADMRQELSAGIIHQTESYILNKADALSGDIEATIELKDENNPLPWCVILSGSISPYGKQILSDYIEQDLAIPKERQIWK